MISERTELWSCEVLGPRTPHAVILSNESVTERLAPRSRTSQLDNGRVKGAFSEPWIAANLLNIYLLNSVKYYSNLPFYHLHITTAETGAQSDSMWQI